MLTKLKMILNALRKGERVLDPKNWENTALIAGALTPFLVALDDVVRAFGIETGLSRSNLEGVGYGIASITGAIWIVCQTVSSRRIGLLPAKKDPPK